MITNSEHRIDLLNRITDLQQEQIAALNSMATELLDVVSRQSAEIETLVMTLTALGQFLVAMKLAPREMADTVVSTTVSGLDPQVRERATRVVELLEFWASRG